MFKTLNIFRIASGWTHGFEPAYMEDLAQAEPFTPCTATQDKSVRWVVSTCRQRRRHEHHRSSQGGRDSSRA